MFLVLRAEMFLCPQEWRPEGDAGEQQGVPQTGGHEEDSWGEWSASWDETGVTNAALECPGMRGNNISSTL